MTPQDNPHSRSYLRVALRVVLVVAFAYGVHLLLNWLHYRIQDQDSTGSKVMLTGIIILILLVYAILIAVPFVPGVEIGLSLLALQGSSIAPLVYLFTVLGLSCSFLVGRLVPLYFVQMVLADFGLRKFSEAVGDLELLSPEDRLNALHRRLPMSFGRFVAQGRYLLLALLINIPGNAIIGGGGGICLTAGLSRIFAPGWTLLTLALAVAPVPLAVYFMWPGFELG